MLNVGEPIGLDVRELAHAALDADGGSVRRTSAIR